MTTVVVEAYSYPVYGQSAGWRLISHAARTITSTDYVYPLIPFVAPSLKSSHLVLRAK